MPDLNLIKQGTTPAFIFEAGEDLDFELIDNVVVTILSGTVLLEKDLASIELDSEHHRISLYLSQKDTFKLKIGDGKMDVRVHLSDGTALATMPYDIKIDGVLNEKVISAYGE